MAFSLSVTDDGEDAPPAGRRWAMTLVVGGGERAYEADVFVRFPRSKKAQYNYVIYRRPPTDNPTNQHTVNLGTFTI